MYDEKCTEMEFLDSNLTKDSSLLFHSIHSPFYWRIFLENHTIFWFQKFIQKIRETRKLESIDEQHFVEWKNEGRKLESEKNRVYAQKLRQKMPFKKSISGIQEIGAFTIKGPEECPEMSQRCRFFQICAAKAFLYCPTMNQPSPKVPKYSKRTSFNS